MKSETSIVKVFTPDNEFCQLPIQDIGVGAISLEEIDLNGNRIGYVTYVKATNRHTCDVLAVFEAHDEVAIKAHDAAFARYDKWLGK